MTSLTTHPRPTSSAVGFTPATRVALLLLIVAAGTIALHNVFAERPAGLGSWSAGIDLTRHALHTNGHLELPFTNAAQARLYQQAGSDLVYPYVLAFYTVVSGATDLPSQLDVLWALPPAYAMLVAVSIAMAYRVTQLLHRNKIVLGTLVGLVALFPIGRTHVVLEGHAGNGLAPVILLLILFLLSSPLLKGKRLDWLQLLILLTLSLTLIHTYHTWANYYVLLGVALAVFSFRKPAFRHVLTTGILLVPLFWMAKAIASRSGLFINRLGQAVEVLVTFEPPETLRLGYYAFGSRDPMAQYAHSVPVTDPIRVSGIVAALLLLLLLAAAGILLLRNWRLDVGRYGSALLGGSGLCFVALIGIGGIGLGIGRGFEVLSCTAAVVLAIASTLATRGRKASAFFVTLAALFVAANLVNSVDSVLDPPKNELLQPAEWNMVERLDGTLPATDTIWGDHRLAAAFLYVGPRDFVTFDTKLPPAEESAATTLVLYGHDCSASIETLSRLGAEIAVMSHYTVEEQFVRRGAPLIGSPQAQACLDEGQHRIIDTGDSWAYRLPPTRF